MAKKSNVKKNHDKFVFDKMCAIRQNFNILSSSFLQTSNNKNIVFVLFEVMWGQFW